MLCKLPFNHNQLHTIIFDWDGTLLDSITPLTECFLEASREFNLPEPRLDEVSQAFGQRPDQVIKQFFYAHAQEDPDFITKFSRSFRKNYSNKKPTLFSPCLETLSKLKNQKYQICIATNKTRAILDKELSETGVLSLIHTSYTPSEAEAKPSPDMLNKIMNTCAVLPENCLMIGDHQNDILAAHEAGMHAIGIQADPQHRRQLSKLNPSGLLKKIEDLPNWIENNRKV